MPIDLVIDERETGPGTKAEGLPGDSNNNANRSNADSASHTDGASTPEVVSLVIFSSKSIVHHITHSIVEGWPKTHLSLDYSELLS